MRILLAMPRAYDAVNLGTARTFFHPVMPESPLAARCVSTKSSSPVTNFNGLWVMGWNEFEAGRADAFAMQHSDVEAEIGWLDVMAEELEKFQADVIWAAIPIKDEQGVTSTAVDGPDEWRVARRISQAELQALPETFTDEDVGGPLLMNTGLWLAKLGPWAMRVHFRERHYFRRGEDGTWWYDKISEDWDFGRQLRTQGLKLVCTRRVTVYHHGEWRWKSTNVWGPGFDKAAMPEVAACP